MIILFRHGTSIANLDPTIYSKIPNWKIPLAERGKLKIVHSALKLGKELKRQKIKELKIFYSPYLRTIRTTRIILTTFKYLFPSYFKIQLKEEIRIREQSWGNFGELKAVEQSNAYGSFFYQHPTGESIAETYDRTYPFVQELQRITTPVLLVSHEVTLALIEFILKGLTVHQFSTIVPLQNAEYKILENKIRYKNNVI